MNLDDILRAAKELGMTDENVRMSIQSLCDEAVKKKTLMI